MISSTETSEAVTALPEEAGSAFRLSCHFRSLTPFRTTVKECNSKACTGVYFLDVLTFYIVQTVIKYSY